jgi:hypothetical protein
MFSPQLHVNYVAARVTQASEVDAVLSAAVERVRVAAVQNRSKGIMITAQEPGSFIVHLSDEVPYGLTRERYAY